MVKYRRRSNMVGWLAFLGIGGAVFVGLMFALMYLKNRQEKIDAKAADQASKSQAKLLDPKKNIRDSIAERYKNKGQFVNQASLKMNVAEKVRSSIAPDKEYTIARVQHQALSKRDDEEDGPVVDEVYIVETVGTTVKLQVVAWEGWEKRREELGIGEDVTKTLAGE